jgi:hypothetical protein
MSSCAQRFQRDLRRSPDSLDGLVFDPQRSVLKIHTSADVEQAAGLENGGLGSGVCLCQGKRSRRQDEGDQSSEFDGEEDYPTVAQQAREIDGLVIGGQS